MTSPMPPFPALGLAVAILLTTLPFSGDAQFAGSGGSGGEGCPGITPPPAPDLGERGPFTPRVVQRTGPDGRFTLVIPEPLGAEGFRHPIATWGNGTSSVPSDYAGLLSAVASHGFVVIASESPRVTAALMRRGLDWVIAEGEGPGELGGHIASECAVALGHSLGGGAALGAGSHPSVIATVSMHGVEGPTQALRGPLLLLTSTSDGAVTRARVTQPLYDRSASVPTFLATLEVPGFDPSFQGHLIPMGSGGEERAPTIAWLRYWVYGDPSARRYFIGPDCVLCRAPWTDVQRKNADWD